MRAWVLLCACFLATPASAYIGGQTQTHNHSTAAGSGGRLSTTDILTNLNIINGQDFSTFTAYRITVPSITTSGLTLNGPVSLNNFDSAVTFQSSISVNGAARIAGQADIPNMDTAVTFTSSVTINSGILHNGPADMRNITSPITFASSVTINAAAGITGDFGAGTLAPAFRIQAINSSASGAPGVYPGIRSGNTGTVTHSFADVGVSGNNGAVTGFLVVDGLGSGSTMGSTISSYVGTASNHPFGLVSNDTERVRISTDSRVGVATRVLTSTLTVAGRIESTEGGFVFPDDSVQTIAWHGNVSTSTRWSNQTSTYDGSLLNQTVPQISTLTMTFVQAERARITYNCTVYCTATCDTRIGVLIDGAYFDNQTNARGLAFVSNNTVVTQMSFTHVTAATISAASHDFALVFTESGTGTGSSNQDGSTTCFFGVEAVP